MQVWKSLRMSKWWQKFCFGGTVFGTRQLSLGSDRAISLIQHFGTTPASLLLCHSLLLLYSHKTVSSPSLVVLERRAQAQRPVNEDAFIWLHLHISFSTANNRAEPGKTSRLSNFVFVFLTRWGWQNANFDQRVEGDEKEIEQESFSRTHYSLSSSVGILG